MLTCTRRECIQLSFLTLAVVVLLLTLPGCRGDSDTAPSADATLSSLTLSNVSLDQIFQSSQTAYTASVGFLQRSVTVIPVATDTGATIRINGTVVASGSSSSSIVLAEGDNEITVVVTAEDGGTFETYTVNLSRDFVALFAQQAYIKASNADWSDMFGTSVAISGDTLIVGAPNESSSTLGDEADNSAPFSGAVYVFTRSGGVWSQQAYLKASNAEEFDYFGASVAISGNTLVVGAYQEDSSANGGESDNSVDNAGAVYIFTRSGGVWSQQAYLKASNAGWYDFFGCSVAISNDTLVVGANGEDSSLNGGEGDNSVGEAGAAYVFTRIQDTWSQRAYLKASNAGVDDNFGSSVAISGDSLVIGAYGEDSSASGGENDNSEEGAGAVYVFERSGGSWNQQTFLKASNADGDDWFGSSVAISDNSMVVGAHREDSSLTGGEGDNSAFNAGAAYVFVRNGGVWSQEAFLKASNAEESDSFGSSVAISGDTIAIGADGESSGTVGSESDNSAPYAGATYVFTRSGEIWNQRAYLKASNAEGGDSFGTNVAISGDTMVVGAHREASSATGGEDSNLISDSGAAYTWQ